MSITGNGLIDLQAPSYGAYDGLLVFSDRNNTSSLTLGGNGTTRIAGSIYAASGGMTLSGNGSNTNLDAEIVVNRLTLSGNNGAIVDNYTQSGNYVVPSKLTLVD